MSETIKLNEALSLMAKAKKLQQTDKNIALDKEGNIVAYDATSKKMDNVQRPVTVMRAIPPHPKKGMRYYFHNYIRFRFSDNFFLKGGSITIPNDGGRYHFFVDKDGSWKWKDAENGKTFTKESLGITHTEEDNSSEQKNLIICKEIGEPTIVKIVKDEELSILTTTYEEMAALPTIETTSSWYGIRKGKVVGIKDIHPHIQVGQVFKAESFFHFPQLYSLYQYKNKKNGCLKIRKFKNGVTQKLNVKRNGWFRKFKDFKEGKHPCMLHLKIGLYDFRNSWEYKKKKFKRQGISLVECYALYENAQITIKKIKK